ncbi:hypothetical protein DFH09DRAFT_289565 [Mycena vulgaris]|nr:hypothetical protein DFH09DRAFT_289565 [Mycena vulgaris]
MTLLLSRPSSSRSLCQMRFLRRFKRPTDNVVAPIASPGTIHVAENSRQAADNAGTGHPSDSTSSIPPLSLTAPPATSTLPLANDRFDRSCLLAAIRHNQEDKVLSPHPPEGSVPPPPHCEVPASNGSVFHAVEPLGIPSASINGQSAPSTTNWTLTHSFGNVVNCNIGNIRLTNVGGNYHEINIYPSSDDNTVATPVLPEILSSIQNDSQRLLPIFGVAIAFHDPPSILQISRVLELKWTEVRDALRPIYAGLGLDSPLDFSSNVKLPSNLRVFLLERTGMLWVDPATYHNILARWCLTGQRTLDPRDIIYSGEFWAHHTRHSNPSAQLYNALRTSWIPLDLVSHTKLADVIVWLGMQTGSQAEDLISIYRRHQNQQPEPVPLMGGMITSASF